MPPLWHCIYIWKAPEPFSFPLHWTHLARHRKRSFAPTSCEDVVTASVDANVWLYQGRLDTKTKQKTHVLGLFLAGREQVPEGPGSWYAGGDLRRRSYGLWWPAVVAGAAAGTGGDPPPPPLPLGPAHAAVAAIALPVTLLGQGTDSHGSAVNKVGCDLVHSENSLNISDLISSSKE